MSSGRKRAREEEEEPNELKGGSLRRRLDHPPDPAAERARELAELDADLDRFAAGESFVDSAGLFSQSEERLSATSDGRRIAPLPGRRKGVGRRGPKPETRPAIDKDTLDAELDAFLKQKD